MRSLRPRARQQGLVVREVRDEILLYDLEAHRAFCLNAAAADVWRCLDGRSSVREVAARLRDETGSEVDEDAVWLALQRLEAAGLIRDAAPERPGALTRRRCLKKLAGVGARAAVLPIVLSIVAPRPADAASVIRPSACNGLPRSACLGQPCSNGKRCTWDERRSRCKCS